MTDFNSKTVWITGASSGIGRDLALNIASESVTLILTARNKQKLDEVSRECDNRGAKTHVLPVDLTDEQAIMSIDESLVNRIDILIHCAGVSQRSLALETITRVNRELMEINFFAAVALTKRVLPGMCKRREGHIIIISSIVGKIGTPMRSGYAAAKHAVHGYFDSLRAELYPHNINVTIACLGYIKTDITMRSLTADGSAYNKIDDALHHGISVEKCSRQIVKAILNNTEEVIVSGIRERLGVLIKRLFPSFFSRIIRRIDATR